MIWLQGAKMCIYAEYKRMSDAVFVCFTLTWIATRLGLYPTWILYSTTIEAPQIVQVCVQFGGFN
jgi:ceramide synthetase